MNEKNISCVVATHNRDEYLKEAIYSIIKQTRAPLEIIVSDNVPSKKTELVVKEIASKNSIPLNYIGHKLGGRGCISRNLAVSESKGEYIAFLDDDDLWDPDYLEKISSKSFSCRSTKLSFNSS